MQIKKHDFVEIEYTGRTADDNQVFDTTYEETAKEHGLLQDGAKYGPVTVCVGEGFVLGALENALLGKSENSSLTVTIKAEDAFGRRSARNIQLIGTQKFRKQGLDPVPGLKVTVDNMPGIIKTVTGGRTLVDFNHPLASRDLIYDVKIGRVIKDDGKKVDAYLKMAFGGALTQPELKDGRLTVKARAELPAEVSKKISEKIREIVPAVKAVEFVTSKAS